MKNITERIIITLFLAFIFSFNNSIIAQNQSETPIKWRMSVKMTSPKEGVLTLRAIISEGWHLYSTELPENGPVPTKFNFSQSKGIKFISDFVPSLKPVTKKDETFGMTLDWWPQTVTFTRKFKLDGNINDAEINGFVKFMGCNDLTCLPPATQTFKTKVKPFNENK